MALRRPGSFTCKYPLILITDQVNHTRLVPVEAKHAFGYLQPLLTPDCVHPHVPNIVSFVAPNSLDQNVGRHKINKLFIFVPIPIKISVLDLETQGLQVKD